MEMMTTRTKIDRRWDLAQYIGVPLQDLIEILYEENRRDYYRIRSIPKASGGTRTIHAVSGKLKDIQRKVLDKLQADFPPSSRAHGFVPERSIITNAIPHRRKKVLVKLDIRDFFPSIHFARVMGLFQSAPFHFGREAAITLAQIICVPEDNGPLPQGGVLSPYVANVICRRLDQKLAAIAREHRCHFTRYADDLTFSTNDVNRLETEQLIARVEAAVATEGFTINSKKTRVLRQSDRQIVTGIVVNDGLNVTRKYLRSLRAILHNIEKDGLEAQLIKDGGFRDRRASRLELKRDGDGYRLGARQLTKEEAIERFLQHLVGRFAFVGQVVNAEGQDNRQIRYPRVVLYKRLLNRFHSRVRDLSKNDSLGEGPKRCERAVRRLLSKYASFDQESEWYRRAKECRQSELKRWQDSKEGQTIRDDLARMTTPDEARHFLATQALRSDVRYWLEFSGNVEELKSKVAEYARFPAANFFDTRQVLLGFKSSSSSQDLAALTHDSPGRTPASLLQILLDRYEPHYYKLPPALRDLIDPMSEALRNIVLQDGEGASLDLVNDPRLHSVMMRLKLETRLVASSGRQEKLGTSVADLLEQSHREGLKRIHKERLQQSVPWKNRLMPKEAIYTVIPALRSSLVNIFESMYRNSKLGQIEVDTAITANGCFQIRIVDIDGASLTVPPGRDFAHGKLRQAAHSLCAIAGYWTFARFDDGEVHLVDMLTGETTKVIADDQPGLTHIIVLPNEKGVIDPPGVGESSRRDESEAKHRRPVRVLVIDNNDQRRSDNHLRWQTLPDLELEMVAAIDQETYASRDLDLVLVHESNPESEWIDQDTNRWPIVFFSGKNIPDCVVHEGRWFVSPTFLRERFGDLADRIVREGGKDCVGLS